MKLNSLQFLRFLAIPFAVVLLLFPACILLFHRAENGVQQYSIHVGDVFWQTFTWSFGVAIVSVAIGWTIGVRLATVKPRAFFALNIVLLMSLAIPAYAMFYTWWQAWPAGSWLHEYVIQHDALGVATKVCAFFAFVSWSWPIPALLASSSLRGRDATRILHDLDGASCVEKCLHRIVTDRKQLMFALLLVASITAGNTTCFDLAQIPSIGNELRAVMASGGSVFDVPMLFVMGICFALLAVYALTQSMQAGSRGIVGSYRSSRLILIAWLFLTCLPLLVGALLSIRSDGFQLWSQYAGDIFISAKNAVEVALFVGFILLISVSLHTSQRARVRIIATMFDLSWIFVAFLPASIIGYAVWNCWTLLGIDSIQRSSVVLIFAQVAQIGFVGALAGRWIASHQTTSTLLQLDSPRSMLLFFRALQPKLLQALCAVVAISIAMSFSEVALTAQLSPPSTNQPIAVALLNAMHYQRPQIVSSALCVMLLLTASGGILVFLCSKRYAAVLLLAVCLPYSCTQYEQTPLENTSVIGSAGLSNGHFITPRAMDSNDDVIVVIDKSGKLQIFNHAGEFISAIELELSGTGYPTGLSLDETGNIWIADTHQNRVLVVSQEGEEILSFGEYGTGEGQFLYPTDIAFGKQDEVYVSEYGGNDRISVFDTEGNYIRSIGTYTSELVSFRRPQSVVVDTDGLLYVADAGNHRVVVLTPMGEVVEIISDVGRGSTQLLYPYGILLDTPSTILVCEFGNNRLHQFSRSGESLGTWGSAGSDVGFLRTPWGIAKSGDGIVVADTGNNRLQVLPYMMNK